MTGQATSADHRVLIASASDSRYMPLLKGLIASLEPILSRPNLSLGCLDTGLGDPDREWLKQAGVQVATPGTHLGVPASAHNLQQGSYLARPFLPDYFPGHDVYVWIDSDMWLQDPGVVDLYVDGALQHGMAITHEGERAYKFQAWLFGWTTKHMLLGYGAVNTARLMTRRHLNNGFFAIAGNAPHWAAWRRRFQAAMERSGKLIPHDQFALNQVIYLDGGRGGDLAGTKLLDPSCNWICDRGVPMWNDALGAFCKPYAPFTPIASLHLAGPGKSQAYSIKRTSGGEFRSFIVRGASPDNPILTSPIEPSRGKPANLTNAKMTGEAAAAA
jgi:hypothetical protein